MSEAVLNQDHVASSPLRFSQLKKLEGRKKCWQSALKLLSYSCLFCSSAPKSKSHVVYFENRNFPGPPNLQGQDHLFPPFMSSLGAECSPGGCEHWRLEVSGGLGLGERKEGGLSCL